MSEPAEPVGALSEVGAPLFEAVIVPHRSLSRRGMAVVMTAICTLSAAVSTAFWWLGAWPIAGFSGAEVALSVALLRYNARAARASERLLLCEQALRIVRTDMHGACSERVLSPFWLNVVLHERQGRVPGLYLVGAGQREEVGAALGETEKLSLAEALRAALHGWRNPRFDNPQLREASAG